MNEEELFESYLEHRIQRDNALTPGQKLDVGPASPGRGPPGPGSIRAEFGSECPIGFAGSAGHSARRTDLRGQYQHEA